MIKRPMISRTVSRTDADPTLERILRDCQAEDRQATPEEMKILVEYIASLAPRALGTMGEITLEDA